MVRVCVYVQPVFLSTSLPLLNLVYCTLLLHSQSNLQAPSLCYSSLLRTDTFTASTHWVPSIVASVGGFPHSKYSITSTVTSTLTSTITSVHRCSWEPILNHIDSKFEDYLNQESRVSRAAISDRRVHCCLYFIAPSGHG